jgi:hypothetical protein
MHFLSIFKTIAQQTEGMEGGYPPCSSYHGSGGIYSTVPYNMPQQYTWILWCIVQKNPPDLKNLLLLKNKLILFILFVNDMNNIDTLNLLLVNLCDFFWKPLQRCQLKHYFNLPSITNHTQLSVQRGNTSNSTDEPVPLRTKFPHPGPVVGLG